jgi:hypothetical protein
MAACAHLRNLMIDCKTTFMGPLPPLIIGILLLARTVYALFSGSASADNKGILREDEPMFYWFVIVAGFIISAFLLVTAHRLRNGS